MKTKNLIQKISILLTFMIAVLFYSCSSTQMTALWKDTSYQGGPLKNFVVIGLMDNLTNRQIYEYMVVQELKRNGIQAFPSLSLLNPEQEYKYEEMESKFNELKIDGIMIIDLKGTEVQTDILPGQRTTLYQTVYDNYYHAYITIKKDVYSPSQVRKTNIHNIEASVYLNQSDKLIWRAELKSIENQYIHTMADDLAILVIESLKNNNLIETVEK